MHPRGLDRGPGHKLCQQAGNPPLTRKIHCQNHLIVLEFDHSKDSLYCKLFVTSTLDMIMDWFSQLNTCIYAFEVVVKQFNVLTVTVYKKSSVHDKKKNSGYSRLAKPLQFYCIYSLFTCDRRSVIYILSTMKSAFRKYLFYNHCYIYL